MQYLEYVARWARATAGGIDKRKRCSGSGGFRQPPYRPGCRNIFKYGPYCSPKIYDNYEQIKQVSIDTIVDFTRADICLQTISWAIDNSINIVVGTTGIKSDLKYRKGRARQIARYR
ncbi:MAG: hypothetical protein U5N58_10195 [Actinomycetota bacterium]|nr:hypothetical protein [Actinomycetota bacterium]